MENIRDMLFAEMSNDSTPIYEPKMNESLELTVYKYLSPADNYVSLTDIVSKINNDNPNYFILSCLRSRNTIKFLGKWERNNNNQFDVNSFKKLQSYVSSPTYTLTQKKWAEAEKAIDIIAKRGLNGGTMAHSFMTCNFEKWGDI